MLKGEKGLNLTVYRQKLLMSICVSCSSLGVSVQAADALAPTFTPISVDSFVPVAGVASNQGNLGPVNVNLDNSAGAFGFDNQFGTERFVSLGANPSQTIPQSVSTGNSIVRTLFSFSTTGLSTLGTDPSRPFVSLVFDYVFDGVNTGDVDQWQVLFLEYNPGGTLKGSTPLALQSTLSPTKTTFGTADIFVSTAGLYGFQVILNETLDSPSTSNTALGFNNIVVRSAVPYELETGLGLGAVGLFMAYRRLKKRAALKGIPSSPDLVPPAPGDLDSVVEA